MPIALNPNKTYWISLASDEDALPAEERPAFEYRFLTYAETMDFSERMTEYANWVESLGSGKEQANERTMQRLQELSARLIEAAGSKMVGWRNLYDDKGKPIAFDREKLPGICTLAELIELVQRQMMQQGPSVEDKKKLESPLPCNTASSATAAASVPTRRQT